MKDTIPCASVGLTDDFDYEQDFPSTESVALRPLADEIRKARTKGREIKILHGRAKGIYVHGTKEGLELRLPTVVWEGPHDPIPSLTMWKTLSWDEVDKVGLENLLALALEARRSEFQTCRYCGEKVPPERRIDDETCHGCAEKHLGVVF